MAVVTWHTPSAQGTSSSLSCTITEPASVAQGDFEFAIFALGSNADTMTAPAGWTLLFDSGGGVQTRYYGWYVTGGRGASAPSLVFTISSTTPLEWHCLAVAGTGLVIDRMVTAAAIITATNPDPPCAVPNYMNDLAISIGMNFSGATPWSTKASFLIKSVNSGALDIAVAAKELVTNNASDPPTFTGPAGTGDVWAATLLLLNADPILVPPSAAQTPLHQLMG